MIERIREKAFGPKRTLDDEGREARLLSAGIIADNTHPDLKELAIEATKQQQDEGIDYSHPAKIVGGDLRSPVIDGVPDLTSTTKGLALLSAIEKQGHKSRPE